MVNENHQKVEIAHNLIIMPQFLVDFVVRTLRVGNLMRSVFTLTSLLKSLERDFETVFCFLLRFSWPTRLINSFILITVNC